MKFKLNGIEKFIIRYYKPLFFAYILLLLLIAVILGNLGMNTIGVMLNTVLLCVMLYVIYVPMRKAKQLQELNDIAFDMYTMIDGCNQMIEAYNQKNTAQLSSFCLFRIIGLVNIGDFDRAEQELKSFWQYFNLKKLHPSDIAQTHKLMANIALEKGDKDLFENEMRIVYEYGNNSTIVGPLRHSYNHNVKDMELTVEAHYANQDSNGQDYERRVFEHLNTNPLTGKPLKKLAKPMYYLMAYNKLFLFFKNTGNIEKATYYAQQLMNIGNEQLSDYRRAKEYLENGNSSN